jgi:ribose transport system permease protein
MPNSWLRNKLSRFLSDYGMLFVLLLLCAYFSIVTVAEQHPTGAAAARPVARAMLRDLGRGSLVVIVAGEGPQEAAFADELHKRLAAGGMVLVIETKGGPGEARRGLRTANSFGSRIHAIAVGPAAARWPIFEHLGAEFPTMASAPIWTPASYRWPNFLKADNLLNVANQIVVIAILAVGMTMVIITGGIDLSVGSLIALSAVVAARVIRDAAGAEQAGAFGMTAGCLAGIGACALLGAFSGLMITQFAIPPFIVTLAMMLVGSGLAYLLAQGQTIYQVPETFVWLGRGIAGLGVPNAVVLMVLLYAAAHVLMSRMALGRYIYAVGGNPEAARLSGVPVKRVLLFVYTVCGALAGLGGVVMASQLKSGSPTFGLMYELYAIAAVVVGGTSLSGGEGKILGTLIGAFIIAVIQNGMNLTGVESYTQKVVLGLVILGAVLLDRLKRRGWSWLRPRRKNQER